MALKIDKKIFGLVVYSDWKEGALTGVKRTLFSKLGIWKRSHLSIEDMQAHPGALAAGHSRTCSLAVKGRGGGGGGGGGGWGAFKNPGPPPPPPEGKPLIEDRLIKHSVRIGETQGIQWYRIQSDTGSSQIYGHVYHKLFRGSSVYGIRS